MSGVRKRALEMVAAFKETMPEILEPPKEIVHADAPSYATLTTTRAYLEKMSAKVAHNELAPSQATAIAQFAALAIRLAEAQIEADLVALEIEATAQAQGQPKVINPPAPRVRS